LKLSAELTISGLYGGQQQEETSEPELELEVLHRAEAEEDLDESEQNQYEDSFLFEAEARKQQEEENVEVFPKFPTFNYQAQVDHEYEQEPSWLFQEARSEENKPIEFASEQEETVGELPDDQVHFEEDVKAVDESSSSSEAAPKPEKKKKPAKKKSMTLTEFFARKEENAEQAKLKVCIVQKGDTIDSLAERYDVTIQNLLRVNHLEINQDVYEGQVLYIPILFAKK
jgi:stage VI sporulation protein D